MSTTDLPPLEVPVPPKKWFLLVCDQEHPQVTAAYQAAMGQWPQFPASSPSFRRATEEDLEALGFVRKGRP
jgi:hypothetical protein